MGWFWAVLARFLPDLVFRLCAFSIFQSLAKVMEAVEGALEEEPGEY